MSNWYKIIKEAGKEAFLLKQRPKIYSQEEWESIVRWAMVISPKYAVWICRLLANDKNAFRLGEDDEKLSESLNLFERVKNRPEFTQKDINGFKSYSALAMALEPFKERGGVREEKRKKRQGGLEKIDSQDGFSLFKIKNFDGAHWVSQGTEWCISQEVHFDEYNNMGPIYFFAKGEDPYALYHFASGQFKEIYDGSMRVSDVMPMLGIIERNREVLQLDDWEDKVDEDESDDFAHEISIIDNTINSIANKKRQYENFSPENLPEDYKYLTVKLKEFLSTNNWTQVNFPVIDDYGATEVPYLSTEMSKLGYIKDSMPEGMYSELLEAYVTGLKDKFTYWFKVVEDRIDLLSKQDYYLGGNNAKSIIDLFKEISKYFNALPIDAKSQLNDFVTVLSKKGVNKLQESFRIDSTSMAASLEIYDGLKDLKDKELTNSVKSFMNKAIENDDYSSVIAFDIAHKKLRDSNLSKKALEGWSSIAQHSPLSYLSGITNDALLYAIHPSKLPEEQQQLLSSKLFDNIESSLAEGRMNMQDFINVLSKNPYRTLGKVPRRIEGPNLISAFKEIISSGRMTLSSFCHAVGDCAAFFSANRDWLQERIAETIENAFVRGGNEINQLFFTSLPKKLLDVDYVRDIVKSVMSKGVDENFVRRYSFTDNRAYHKDILNLTTESPIKEKIVNITAQLIASEGHNIFKRELESNILNKRSWYGKTKNVLEIINEKLPEWMVGDPTIENAAGILETALQESNPEAMFSTDPSTSRGIEEHAKYKQMILKEIQDGSLFERKSEDFKRLYAYFYRQEDIKSALEKKIKDEDVNHDNVLNIEPIFVKGQAGLVKLIGETATDVMTQKLKDNFLYHKPQIDNIFATIYTKMVPERNLARERYKELFNAHELVSREYRQISPVISYEQRKSPEIQEMIQKINSLKQDYINALSEFKEKHAEIINFIKGYNFNIREHPFNINELSARLNEFRPYARDLNWTGNFNSTFNEVVNHYIRTLYQSYGEKDPDFVRKVINVIVGKAEYEGSPYYVDYENDDLTPGELFK